MYPQRSFTHAKRKTFKVIYQCQAEEIEGHLLCTRKGHLLANGGHSGYKLIQKFTKRPIKFIVTNQSQQTSHAKFKVES